jgi:hypothetical protein
MCSRFLVLATVVCASFSLATLHSPVTAETQQTAARIDFEIAIGAHLLSPCQSTGCLRPDSVFFEQIVTCSIARCTTEAPCIASMDPFRLEIPLITGMAERFISIILDAPTSDNRNYRWQSAGLHALWREQFNVRFRV